MKPEQQRIAIAEACGWKPVEFRNCRPKPCSCDTDKPNHNSPPNYLNDLNAMHEAEKVLIRPNLYAKGGWRMYLRYLSIVTDERHPIDDTASKRAEAFLRTIGKWTTNPNKL